MELSLWWGKKNGAGGRDLAFIAKGAEWEFELKIQRSKLSQIWLILNSRDLKALDLDRIWHGGRQSNLEHFPFGDFFPISTDFVLFKEFGKRWFDWFVVR
jgi:hypothetical protein